MIRELLREMGGMGVYGITSMFIFVFVFVMGVAWALFMRKSHVHHMSHLPLEHDAIPSEGEDHHD